MYVASAHFEIGARSRAGGGDAGAAEHCLIFNLDRNLRCASPHAQTRITPPDRFMPPTYNYTSIPLEYIKRN